MKIKKKNLKKAKMCSCIYLVVKKVFLFAAGVVVRPFATLGRYFLRICSKFEMENTKKEEKIVLIIIIIIILYKK